MFNTKMLIGRFSQIKNTATGEFQWQCSARGRFAQKKQRVIYVAKHDLPPVMVEGFYIFQEAESVFIRDNWKLAVFAVRIIAPVPWPADNKITLSQLRCKKRGEPGLEWGFESYDGQFTIRYIVGGPDEQRVSAKDYRWFAELDHAMFISPGGHFIVIRIKLIQLQNNPAELPFAVI